VLTNRHVLEEIANQDAAGAWTLKWPDATLVDFIGEDSVAAATKFTVTGVTFTGPDPINRTINFAHLDMAILRVDPASDASNTFPKPVTFETDTAQPKADRDLYVVGFPGEPKTWLFGGTPPVGHETTKVISTVFNNKFGVKRLAPGTIKAGPGGVRNDAKRWICAHADHKAVIAWERFMRESEHAAPSTVRRRLAALSSLFKHLVRHGFAKNLAPVAEIERPAINRDEGSTLAFAKAQARLSTCASSTGSSGS